MALERTSPASLDFLPEDCFICIFSHSGDVQSLGRAAQTCKRFREFYLRDGIWQALLSRELGSEWKSILSDVASDSIPNSSQKNSSSHQPDMLFNFRALCRYRTIYEFEEESQADPAEFDRLYSRLQISVVGPPQAGKTWLLASLDQKDPFSYRYQCTSGMQIRTKNAFDGESVKYQLTLQVWESTRPSCHAWMLCYDVTSRQNFTQLVAMEQAGGGGMDPAKKPASAAASSSSSSSSTAVTSGNGMENFGARSPELLRDVRAMASRSRYNKPCVVVGCRRSNGGDRQVSIREGYQFAESIGAQAYFEVEATNRPSVKRAVLATATLAMGEKALRNQGAGIARLQAPYEEEGESSCLTM